MWVPICGYEGVYDVSSDGLVRSWHTGEEVVLSPGYRGEYQFVTLCKNKIKKYVSVHRVVAENFIPNPNNKPEVNHKNGIKTDNVVQNLEWVTREENQQHAILNKLKVPLRGEDHPGAKLTSQLVEEIRKMATLKKHTHEEIASMFGVCRSNISMIIGGKLWKKQDPKKK